MPSAPAHDPLSLLSEFGHFGPIAGPTFEHFGVTLTHLSAATHYLRALNGWAAAPHALIAMLADESSAPAAFVCALAHGATTTQDRSVAARALGALRAAAPAERASSVATLEALVALNLRDAPSVTEARGRAIARAPSAVRDDALLALERAVLHEDFAGAGALLRPHAQRLDLAFEGDEGRGRTYAARFYESVLDAQRVQDTLDPLLRSHPTDRETALTRARAAITIANDGYTAAQVLDALVNAGGEATPQVLGWRGRARAMTNHGAEAIADLDAALAGEASDGRERAEWFAARAQAHSTMAKHMSAERDLTEAIACAPKRGSLRARRAAVRATVLRPLDAADDYAQALALAPLECQTSTLADLAACLFNGRRYAEAEMAYARAARAFEARPNESDRLATLLEQRGACLHFLGRFGEAVEEYTRALAYKPTYGKAHSDRGEALLELGRDEAAFADLERALAEGYKAGCTLVARGTYFQRKGEHARAIAELDEAARVWPSSPVPFEARARSLEATGEARRAHDDREHASVLRATRRS